MWLFLISAALSRTVQHAAIDHQAEEAVAILLDLHPRLRRQALVDGVILNRLLAKLADEIVDVAAHSVRQVGTHEGGFDVPRDFGGDAVASRVEQAEHHKPDLSEPNATFRDGVVAHLHAFIDPTLTEQLVHLVESTGGDEDMSARGDALRVEVGEMSEVEARSPKQPLQLCALVEARIA
jgi:hypothetical protein